jgi:hypothetical protein
MAMAFHMLRFHLHHLECFSETLTEVLPFLTSTVERKEKRQQPFYNHVFISYMRCTINGKEGKHCNGSGETS